MTELSKKKTSITGANFIIQQCYVPLGLLENQNITLLVKRFIQSKQTKCSFCYATECYYQYTNTEQNSLSQAGNDVAYQL